MPNVNVVIQPVSQLVTENTSVTFSTSGSLAGTSLSAQTVVYQWQRSFAGTQSFSAIAGATNADYTVTATAGLDNNTFRARLSAIGVDAAVFTNIVTLAIKTSGDIYSPWEVNTFESGQNRVRRLQNLGYL